MIFLGGDRLLEQEFFTRGLFSEERGLLKTLDPELLCTCFSNSSVTRVKIPISWAVTERITRLTPEGRLSVEERISNLPRLELMQDGNVLACFPLVSRESGDGAEDDSDSEDEDMPTPQEDKLSDIQDTNNETARSVYQLLQLIAFRSSKSPAS